ncbi:MAG: hypothetical protein P8M73_02715 [Luminiphilus sp.]|nr:hypothetical protein [Luminiphilus sp.]
MTCLCLESRKAFATPYQTRGRYLTSTAGSQARCRALASLPDQTIALGVVNLCQPEVESVDTIVYRVESALACIDKDQVVLAPGSGMKQFSREASL